MKLFEKTFKIAKWVGGGGISSLYIYSKELKNFDVLLVITSIKQKSISGNDFRFNLAIDLHNCSLIVFLKNLLIQAHCI